MNQPNNRAAQKEQNASSAHEAAAAAFEDAALSGLCEEGCLEVARAAFLQAQPELDAARKPEPPSAPHGNEQ